MLIRTFKQLWIGEGQCLKSWNGASKWTLRYAKRIIKDGEDKIPTEIAPGTKVYELVEELAKYLPEEVRKQFT